MLNWELPKMCNLLCGAVTTLQIPEENIPKKKQFQG